jgi:glutamine synthetase
VPGADVNPYLALAAILACGHYGIKNKLEPHVPISNDEKLDTNNPKLPRSLESATDLMNHESSFARLVLGNEFVDHYAATRYSEIRKWSTAVTDYELKRYIETI